MEGRQSSNTSYYFVHIFLEICYMFQYGGLEVSVSVDEENLQARDFGNPYTLILKSPRAIKCSIVIGTRGYTIPLGRDRESTRIYRRY